MNKTCPGKYNVKVQDGKYKEDNDNDKYDENDKYDDNNNDNDNDNNNDSDNEPSDCAEQHCGGLRNSTVKVQDEALVRAKALNETSLKSLQDEIVSTGAGGYSVPDTEETGANSATTAQ